MRLDSISGVGEQAANVLYTEGGFRTAEGVAYGFGPEIVSLEGIDANIYLNAQDLVVGKSSMSAEKTLEQQPFFCNSCDQHEGIGSSFNNETGCLAHMRQCGGIR